MSDRLHSFESIQSIRCVSLPFSLPSFIEEWSSLRQRMIRDIPKEFTRDEWAYLIRFLDSDQLWHPFTESFGRYSQAGLPSSRRPSTLLCPRGLVAIWLPNNVSLLGPLTLILTSLTGNPQTLKAGSRTQDLASFFLDYARDRTPPGRLSDYLREQVVLDRFDRDDPRNLEMARSAAIRIVFGSDDTVAGIDRLPHPPDSMLIGFSDRRSEAWLEPSRFDDTVLRTLLAVFAIYGQAGCTSPKRVVVLEGMLADAHRLRDRLVELWPRTIERDPPMHIASENIMAHQYAAMNGWDVQTTERQGAVLAVGKLTDPLPSGLMTLPIVSASVDEAIASLPINIQTIGHALTNPVDSFWLEKIAASSVLRFVPLDRMHHFGPIWDGWNYWQRMFREVEIGS